MRSEKRKHIYRLGPPTTTFFNFFQTGRFGKEPNKKSRKQQFDRGAKVTAAKYTHQDPSCACKIFTLCRKEQYFLGGGKILESSAFLLKKPYFLSVSPIL